MEVKGRYDWSRCGKDSDPLRSLRLTDSGDSFVAGDVLLEIETDKAQMDVEAQDDGILAKITVRQIQMAQGQAS